MGLLGSIRDSISRERRSATGILGAPECRPAVIDIRRLPDHRATTADPSRRSRGDLPFL